MGRVVRFGVNGFATLTEACPMSTTVTRRYPTDLTDAQWQRIRPLIPPAKPGGNDHTTSMREVLNAIFYLLSTTGG